MLFFLPFFIFLFLMNINFGKWRHIGFHENAAIVEMRSDFGQRSGKKQAKQASSSAPLNEQNGRSCKSLSAYFNAKIESIYSKEL